MGYKTVKTFWVTAISCLLFCVANMSSAFALQQGQQYTAIQKKQAIILWIGHSLIGHDIPALTASLSGSLGKANDYDVQIKNGAPLKCNTQKSCGAHEGVWAFDALRSGKYDTVILTEAMPLDNHLAWSEPARYGALYYNAAVRANPRTRVFMFEGWHCRFTGTIQGCTYDQNDDLVWAPRIYRDHAKWVKIVREMNQYRTVRGTPVQLIPVATALAALSEQIDSGAVAGLSGLSDLFEDDIHLNDVGKYFVACVVYSSLYGSSPEGGASTNLVTGSEWHTVSPVTLTQAKIFQNIAYRVVTGKY